MTDSGTSFSPCSTMFSTHSEINFHQLYQSFHLSSATAFNLDGSKILLSGKCNNSVPNDKCLH